MFPEKSRKSPAYQTGLLRTFRLIPYLNLGIKNDKNKPYLKIL
ncbi:hypothetical protein SAMN04515674_104348 [Pseudarcicella hirudinis]|uniref:Uncharacterized protein n=1 Tax=Pseudarcicella hirudinis TaxID=1079859 RepID=A0A1I5S0Z7_9BACT|nr:hypothetical protein SAMN04515674_104348 [Pseudarcicella hirudinis]